MKNFMQGNKKNILTIKEGGKKWEPMVLVYAQKGENPRRIQEGEELKREFERLKGSLQGFIRDSVKKQLKEERDYYKSRPAQAAKYYGDMLGDGFRQNITNSVTAGVYSRIETQMRYEWMRRGR